MTQKPDTAAAAQTNTPKAVFIANKNDVRIGDEIYHKGDTVPYVEGRNYDRAVRQGTLLRLEGTPPQVSAMASALASGAAQLESAGNNFHARAEQLAPPVKVHDRTGIAPLAEIVPITTGVHAYWVGGDGAYSRVFVKEVQPIDAAAAEDLGLLAGQLAPKVIFEGETEATFVHPHALLPEQPTTRLIAELSAEREEDEPQGGQEGKEAAPFAGIPLEADSNVFVLEDDTASSAFFVGVRFATPEDAEHPAINEGEPVAVLDFYASPEDFAADKKTEGIAPLSDIVPAEIFTRIAEAIRAQEAAEAEASAAEDDAEAQEDDEFVSQLIQEHTGYQIIIKAMRRGVEEGAALPDKMPMRKTIINNGLTNIEAFTLAAEGGPETLTLLDGVSDDKAQSLFEYAVKHEWVDPVPEDNATPEKSSPEDEESGAGAVAEPEADAQAQAESGAGE